MKKKGQNLIEKEEEKKKKSKEMVIGRLVFSGV